MEQGMNRETQIGNAAERSYGIDLLRILLMGMVLALHLLGHGGLLIQTEPFSLRYGLAWLLEILCYCSVDCYMLISGYIWSSNRYRYSNIAVLWLRVLFYSVLITAVFQFGRPDLVRGKTWLAAFLPVTFNQYWFFTAYVLTFFMIPVLNKAGASLTQKQQTAVLLTLGALLCLLPTAFQQDPFASNFGNSALSYIYLYMVGAYVRRFGLLKKRKAGWLLRAYLLCSALLLASKFLIEWASLRFMHTERIGNHLINYASPVVIAQALFLLLAFERLQVGRRCRKLVQVLSPLAFSVYLLHEHPLVRENLVAGRMAFLAELPVPLMLPAFIAIVVGLFAVLSAFDFVRERIFRKLKLKDRLYAAETKYLRDLWHDQDAGSR